MRKQRKDTGVLLRPLTFEQTIVELARVPKPRSVKAQNLEDYEPGATQAQVFKSLKKVAKSPKPSGKPS